MNSPLDWSVVGPFALSAAAFGVVYVTSLVGGASAEDTLLRSTGALLVAGVASFLLRALVRAALPSTDDARGVTIDITLPEAAPDSADARPDHRPRP
jgi:hypothetical protein